MIVLIIPKGTGKGERFIRDRHAPKPAQSPVAGAHASALDVPCGTRRRFFFFKYQLFDDSSFQHITY